jgi:membrane fusion protein (multidrug efflux system)
VHFTPRTYFLKNFCPRLVFGSTLLFLTVLSLTGCKASGPPPGAAGAQGAVAVQVASAAHRDVPVVGDWVAVTDGFVNAQIQPQVGGYLIRQDYTEGSEVHKDQILFEIDPRPLQAALDQAKGQLAQSQSQVVQAQAQLAQAQAQLAQAQAQLELAAINVARDTPLAAAHAISQSTLDTELKTQQADKAAVDNQQASIGSAQAAVVTAQAAVVSSRAAVETAELNLGFTKVRSLIDGIAGQAAVQVGNLVGTSSVLTSVSQLQPIKVFFSISEQEYLALAARARASGKADLLSSGNLIPLKLTLSDGRVFPETGHIVFVDRSLTAQTGALRLAASFSNPGNLLRPGQFGRVSAQTDVLHNAVLVPQKAVSELQGQNQVDVAGPDDVIHIRNVTLGPQVGSDIVILSGLSGDERVVTEGNDKLREGSKVAPQAASASPSGLGTTSTPGGK